jgi:ATP-dependent DNA helicase RecG
MTTHTSLQNPCTDRNPRHPGVGRDPVRAPEAWIPAYAGMTEEISTDVCSATRAMLVGVSDSGKVMGVTLGKETLNEWLGQIKSATSPSLIPDIAAHQVEGKTVVEIDIGEFPVKPVSTRGRYYKRVASSNHALGSGEIADLYMQSLQLSWDAYEAQGYTVDDLSEAKIKHFIQQVKDKGRFALETTELATLEKLNYITHGHPTWAAMLLFAKEPIRHHIHIGRFKTPDMIIDDRQFTDTLFEVVEQSMKFIISYISVAFEFDGSIQRKERFGYPLSAIREALLNAVIHRSYTDGSDIQIKIFDNSITLFSPGQLYGGLRLVELESDNYKSRLRNKLVAEAFYLTGNIEKYGSGFIRIRKALKDYPEIKFKAEEISGGIALTFTQSSQPESRPESLGQRVLNLLLGGAMSKQEIQQGMQQGEAIVLERLLTRRFGPQTPETLNRLTNAPLDQLEHWADNILDATSLEEVFTNH